MTEPVEIKSVPISAVLHAFTYCVPLEEQPLPLLLDLRDNKAFKKEHVMQSYCIRLGGEGRALLDYSKNQYKVPWSKDCWWNKHVIVYGEPGMKRDHPVLQFLHKQGRVKSLCYVKEGYAAIRAAYPYLCTVSVKPNAIKRYPGEIIAGLLYLGDWDNARDVERLRELNIKTVVTIHNQPENLKVPSTIKHLQFTLADVSTENISQFFAPTYDCIDEARSKGHAVLVHCGAGVSRSATLCMAFIMRDRRMTAHDALELVKQRRSIVEPNDGFWKTLCALEAQLGLQKRSDVKEHTGHPGRDAVTTAPPPAAVALAEDAAGVKVTTCWVPATTGHTGGATGGATATTGHTTKNGGHERGGHERDAHEEGRRGREGTHDEETRRRDRRSRSRDRHRSRSRDRHSRDRHRSRSRDRHSRDRHSRDRRRVRFEDPPRPSHSPHHANGTPSSANTTSGLPDPSIILSVEREGITLGEYHIGSMKPGQTVVFGRLPSCDVHLEHLSISRQHAQLQVQRDGTVTLTDLASGHGTNVDGVWIRANTPKVIKKGSVIKFGASTRALVAKKL